MTARPPSGGSGRRARTGRSAALLLAALAASACAGPGLGARYRALEDEWRRSAEAAPPRADADPFAGTPTLEREVLVREVLRRNPTLQAARHAWRAALARYPQETSLDDPMLSYGVAPRSFGSDAVDDGHQVELSQAFPFPGKLALRGQIALAEAEAAGRDAEAVRLGLAAMASILFDDYALAARALALNAQHAALLEELQQVAAARYEAGEASQQDPLAAEVELAHVLHRDLGLAAEQRVTGEQINLLLHRRPDLPLPPPPGEIAPPDLGALDLEALEAEGVASRPELRSAASRVTAREAAVDLARREFFPDVTLVGMYDGIWQEKELQPFVGISFAVPLRLGRRRAAVEEARAELERARSERTGLEDEVRFSVRAAAARLEETRHVLHLYQDRLLPAARDQVEAARAGFESGQNDFTALIAAERNLRDVELGLEETRADLWRRHAELLRATGRLP